MTVDELREAAKGEGCVTLVVPAPKQIAPSRLFGRQGPRVDVVCVNANGNAVVRVDRAALRKWLDKHIKE